MLTTQKNLMLALWVGSLIIILTLSFLPEDAPLAQIGSSSWWNLGHIPAYGLLTWLTMVVAAPRVRLTWPLLLLIVLIVSCFSITVEVMQPYVGRMASVHDAAYNIFGAAIALGIYFVTQRRKAR